MASENEATFYRHVVDALSTWLAKVRVAVLAAWHRFRGRPDPAAVYTASPLWSNLVDRLEIHLRDVAHGGALAIGKTADEQFIETQLLASHNLLMGIPDEVHALIQKEITDAVNAGNTPEQIAARVDALLTTSGSARWTNRAKVIAVTEVHRMAGAGQQAAMMALQQIQGKTLYKTWNSHHDDRTRDAHLGADGQTVPVNQRFQVGEDHLLYPGDPMAPASTVINCRCDMSVSGVTG